MDHQIRDLERRARLEPALWPALVRARRRAWLPPVDLTGVVAEARRLEADLTEARDVCAAVHGRLLVPFVQALFAEEQDLDLVVVSWWAAVREHVFVHVALDGPEVRNALNFALLAEHFGTRPDVFVLPRVTPGVETGWHMFPIMIRPESGVRRADFQQHMEAAGVDTRMVWTGNLTRQPAFKNVEHRVAAGETLEKIALRYYNDTARWPEILAANRAQLLADKALLVGRLLVIP